jgi:hypothetical protein
MASHDTVIETVREAGQRHGVTSTGPTRERQIA